MKRTMIVLVVLLVVVLVSVGAVIGLLALGGVFGGGIGVSDRTVLEIDFEAGVPEISSDDPFAKILSDERATLTDVVEALLVAAEDERVVGLVARVGAGDMSFAQAQEIRDAVAAFRAKGKTAVAFSETFGELGPGNVGYFLASGFDEVWMQPSGDIGLTGLMLESQFLRGTLDKLEVEVRMDHRHEYKNAMNQYTETSFTEAHRQSMLSILESWREQLVDGIAEGRELTPERVADLIDDGPFLGQEALEAGLVDGIGYRDEVYARVREGDDGSTAQLLYVHKYRGSVDGPWSDGTRIALIRGIGAVQRGNDGYNPLYGIRTMGSDTVAGAFRAAIEDDSIEAIVFRVDSPGGSYVASDAIWRETVRAREADKPVVVTMGSAAASGGYFVSADAHRIVAQPGTLTGSIGVLGGKLLTTGLWNKLGISFDEVHLARNATMYSTIRDYNEYGWSRHQAWLDRVYEDFTRKVAEGRDLPLERVQEIARGRVWTGAEAHELGLVDELGGYVEAVALAREAIGLDPDADVQLVPFPRPRSFFERLTDEGPPSSDPQAAVLRSVIEAVRPLARAAARAGLLEAPRKGPLALPEVPEAR